MIFLLTMVDFQQDYEPTSHGDPEKDSPNGDM
jgi:hypothetical protein